MNYNDTQEAKQLYNEQAENFGQKQSRYPATQALKTLIDESLGNIQDKTILFAGCGDGQECLYAAEHGATVIGIDISERSIELARGHCQNGEFHVMDIGHITLPHSSCDIVISHFAVMYAENLEAVLLEFKKVLKNDGFIILSVPHPVRKMIKYNQMNYFVKGKHYENWKGITRFGYYRLFENYVDAFARNDLKLIQLIEPKPVKEHEQIPDNEISYPHSVIFKLVK